MNIVLKGFSYKRKDNPSIYSYPVYVAEDTIFFEFSLRPFKAAKIVALPTTGFIAEFEKAIIDDSGEAEKCLFKTTDAKNIIIESFESNKILRQLAEERCAHVLAIIDSLINAGSCQGDFLNGLLKVSQGFYSLSLKDWEGAKRKNPNYSLTYFYLGNYYYKEGDFEKALENYKNSFDRYHEDNWLRAVIQNNYACSCLKLAIEKIKLPDLNLEQTKKLLEHSLSLFNEIKELDSEMIANLVAANLYFGNVLYELKDPRAEEIYIEALSLRHLLSDKYPYILINEGAVFFQQATILRELGNPLSEVEAKLKEAIQRYEEAEKLVEEETKNILPSIYYNLSKIWGEQSNIRDFKKSCEYIEKAIEAALDNNQEIPEWYYSQLITAYMEAGISEAAKSSFLLGVRAKQGLQDIKKKIKEANKYRDRGYIGDAKALYEDVLARDKNNIEALYGLGQCYQYIGNPEKGAKQYEKALRINPEIADIFEKLIKMCCERADYGKALEYCEKIHYLNKLDYEKLKEEIVQKYFFSSVFCSSLASNCWNELDRETKEHLKVAELEYYRHTLVGEKNFAHPLLRLALAIEAEFNQLVRSLNAFLRRRGFDPSKLPLQIQWENLTDFSFDRLTIANYIALLEKRIFPKKATVKYDKLNKNVCSNIHEFMGKMNKYSSPLKKFLNDEIAEEKGFIELRNESAHSNFWIGNRISEKEILKAREIILGVNAEGQRLNPNKLNAVELIFSMIKESENFR